MKNNGASHDPNKSGSFSPPKAKTQVRSIRTSTFIRHHSLNEMRVMKKTIHLPEPKLIPRVITICDAFPGVLELWSDGFPMLQHSTTPPADFTVCGDAWYNCTCQPHVTPHAPKL
jgi:hypothetical protein